MRKVIGWIMRITIAMTFGFLLFLSAGVAIPAKWVSTYLGKLSDAIERFWNSMEPKMIHIVNWIIEFEITPAERTWNILKEKDNDHDVE